MDHPESNQSEAAPDPPGRPPSRLEEADVTVRSLGPSFTFALLKRPRALATIVAMWAWLVGAAVVGRWLGHGLWGFVPLSFAGIIVIGTIGFGRARAIEAPRRVDVPRSTEWTIRLIGAATGLVFPLLFVASIGVAVGDPVEISVLLLVSYPVLVLLAFMFIADDLTPGTDNVQIVCNTCGRSRDFRVGGLWPLKGFCPRCRRRWRVPVEWLSGPRLTPWRCAVIAVGLLGIVAAFALPSLVVRQIPSSTLIRIAARASMPVQEVWAEVNRRTLTDEQVERLASELVERRERRGDVPIQADRWLAAHMHMARLAPETFAAHFRSWFDLELALAGAIAPPDPSGPAPTPGVVEVCLDVATYDREMSAMAPLVYVEGVWVGDDRNTIQLAQTLSTYRVGWGYGPRERSVGMSLDLPMARFDLPPGDHTINAAVWLVVPARRAAEPEIVWAADGTLDAPDAMHVERREMSLTVRVGAMGARPMPTP